MDCSVLLRWFYLSTAFLGRNKTEPTSNKYYNNTKKYYPYKGDKNK